MHLIAMNAFYWNSSRSFVMQTKVRKYAQARMILSIPKSHIHLRFSAQCAMCKHTHTRRQPILINIHTHARSYSHAYYLLCIQATAAKFSKDQRARQVAMNEPHSV